MPFFFVPLARKYISDDKVNFVEGDAVFGPYVSKDAVKSIIESHKDSGQYLVFEAEIISASIKNDK